MFWLGINNRLELAVRKKQPTKLYQFSNRHVHDSCIYAPNYAVSSV